MVMDVDALIAKAHEELSQATPEEHEVTLGGEKVTVRLRPIPGPEYRDLAARHPMREGSIHDLALGYDLDAVLAEYPRVELVDGDDVVDVSAKWKAICAVLSAVDLKKLAVAVWYMMDRDDEQVAAAGKALAGKPSRKRR